MMEVYNEMQKFNLDILALQEVRWKGSGRIDKKDFSLYYSGNPEKSGMYGTAFMINANLRKSVLGFEPISDRVCRIRIKGRFWNTSMISAYAPTEEAPEEDKVTFYDQLAGLCGRVPKHDIVLLLGDFNAKIGKEVFLAEVAGKNTLHDECNKMEDCLLSLLRNIILLLPAQNLNTKRYTWVLGKCQEQIL
ncbi:craniofacial development protein 2-like [Nilaparvata lugens]|uniref:craniofacial development protein 2-like n=1 Tax=Nilaparvata lugens TaxID=108931 RepID=UPI00193EAC70|nr:craniofacial development protein 2-like [Nilaparvata lugens]